MIMSRRLLFNNLKDYLNQYEREFKKIFLFFKYGMLHKFACYSYAGAMLTFFVSLEF